MNLDLTQDYNKITKRLSSWIILIYKIGTFLVAAYLFTACILCVYAQYLIISFCPKLLVKEEIVGSFGYIVIVELGWPYIACPAMGLCPVSGFFINRSYFRIIPPFPYGVSVIAIILWFVWSIAFLISLYSLKKHKYFSAKILLNLSFLNIFCGILAIFFPFSWGDFSGWGEGGTCCPAAIWNVTPIIFHSLLTFILFRRELLNYIVDISGTKEIAHALHPFLKDPNPYIRIESIIALIESQEVKVKELMPSLVETFKDVEPEVYQKTIERLKKVYPDTKEEIILAFKKILNQLDLNDPLRNKIKQALEAIEK